MGYVEYFNLLNSGYKSISFALSGVPFLVIGIVGLFLIFRFRRTAFVVRIHPRFLLIFMSFWTAFAIFWTTTNFVSTYTEYLTIRNALLDNKYQEIQGYVENFHPMPYGGHDEESFSVQGVSFAYSDYLVTKFSTTQNLMEDQ
jgi:predicted membrane protein